MAIACAGATSPRSKRAPRILLLAGALQAVAFGHALDRRGTAAVSANPIRKVVNLLESMRSKIEADARKEQELFKKFGCYCKTSSASLSTSIADATAKVPAVSSDIIEKESQKSQMEEDLKQHRSDRASAKDAIAQATAIREKEASAFAKEKAEYESNIGALAKAIAALKRGMAGGFLQTRAARVLRRIVASQDMNDSDRQELMAFLDGSQGSGYAPKSGEITGILEQIKEDMEKGLADATATEKSAVASYKDLTSAKKKEVRVLSASIEEKSQRVGEMAVEIITAKDDLTDTQRALLEDQKLLADLEKDCADKENNADERAKTRSEELAAIAETITLLNDDESLELFKKTLPSASASLVQLRDSAAVVRSRALAVVQRARASATSKAGTGSPVGRSAVNLDFISMALHGKKIGFEKILKMIDEMVGNLKAEQVEDDRKKEYCGVQIDSSEDRAKELQHAASDHEATIAEAEDRISVIKEEIKALEGGMQALDKSVAEAGSQRKEEHAEFLELMSSNSEAKKLLKTAINRLNKFYNPALHMPEPTSAFAQVAKHVPVLTQVSSQHQSRAAATLADAPTTPQGPYEKKSGQTAGVISILDTLVRDLDKEMTAAETSEQASQKSYEELMNDAIAKKSSDSKALTGKGSALAAAESELETHKEGKASNGKELMAALRYQQSLHAECDWLLQYYDVRKEARAGETSSLNDAKAILSGADFSLLQRPPAPVPHGGLAPGFLKRL